MYANHIQQHPIYRNLSDDELKKQLPSTLLTVDGVAKIVDDVLTESHGEIFGQLPQFQYFLVKFDQYHNGTRKVHSSHSPIITTLANTLILDKII
jgi:hypothetical protein